MQNFMQIPKIFFNLQIASRIFLLSAINWLGRLPDQLTPWYQCLNPHLTPFPLICRWFSSSSSSANPNYQSFATSPVAFCPAPLFSSRPKSKGQKATTASVEKCAKVKMSKFLSFRQWVLFLHSSPVSANVINSEEPSWQLSRSVNEEEHRSPDCRAANKYDGSRNNFPQIEWRILRDYVVVTHR